MRESGNKSRKRGLSLGESEMENRSASVGRAQTRAANKPAHAKLSSNGESVAFRLRCFTQLCAVKKLLTFSPTGPRWPRGKVSSSGSEDSRLETQFH
ncbi:hypothetical protein AVEN_129710-1 [Araneus ventricosus]|uniref:Uncharacterized protein n=1 Tax=Araneus ventricosus TaxID=182803 RepID=A0A4Y2DK66_ARAVE|nr:hypothetical protein AVEN_129710-1 [Araneus ventricosus]